MGILKSTNCCSTSGVPCQQPQPPLVPPGREFPGPAGVWGQHREMFLTQPCRAQGRAAGVTSPEAACSVSGVVYKVFRFFSASKKVAEAGQARGDAERQLFLRQTPGLLLEKYNFLLDTKGFSHTEPHGAGSLLPGICHFSFANKSSRRFLLRLPPHVQPRCFQFSCWNFQ